MCFWNKKISIKKSRRVRALTLTEDIELMVNLYPEFKASYANNAIANVKPLNSIKKIAFQRARWNFGGLIIVLNHSFIKGKLPLNYYFFNVILWHLLSISFLPLFVYFLYINLTAFQSVLFFLINSLTIIGVVSSLYLNPFGITGVLLVGLLFYSILRSKYYTNNYLYMSFLLYFGYLLFMQFSTVLGVIKYMFVKKKIFIN